jgi:hypothetical protein
LDRLILENLEPQLSYSGIAEVLTYRNIPTPRGGDVWNAMSVMRAMNRLGISK